MCLNVFERAQRCRLKIWNRKLNVACAILVGIFPAIPTTCGVELGVFQAGQGGWQLGTIALGNIDSDPALEVIVPYRDPTGVKSVWFLDAFKLNGERVPGFPYAGGEQAINVSPTLYDLDADGRLEILFTSGNKVVALRGEGTVLWSTGISSQNYVPDAGYQVVTNGFYWSTDGSWRSTLPESAQFFSEVSPPIVADTDGNGALKVLTAWKILPDSTSKGQDYNPFIKQLYGFGEWGTVGDEWSGGVVFCEALSGKKDAVYHFHQLVEAGLGVGRHRPGSAPLVYALNDSDSVAAFDKTKPYGLWGHGMMHKQFGKNQRLQSGSYLKGVDIYPADIDGDGEDELLVPTTQLDPLWQPCETILDDDGAVLWRKWKDSVDVSVANGWLNSACMIPVNPDHDNHIDVLSFTHSFEIAFRYWNGIELVDRPGWPKQFQPFLPTPPVVGDVDGDGQEEIVIGTYDPAAVPSSGKLYVFALDGTEELSFDVPGGLKHIPTLADANGDGSLEIVFRSLDGRVWIHNLGASTSGNVSWATHRGNARHDGNRGATLFPEGTPRITRKVSGYRRASFEWASAGKTPVGYEIYRADHAVGPFSRIAELPETATSFTDSGLRDGWQYFYEVRALYDSGPVASAPFAILSLLSGNLIANPGFEECGDSHWDKWFTGEIPWQNMTVSEKEPYQGKRSMEIRLANHGSNSSIKQSNQYGTPDPAIRTQPGKLYSFGGWLRSGGLSQPSEHWLEWNTTRTGDNTNNIPPAPWPLYFTPPLVIGTEPRPWTYVNRVFVMPEGFPNVELRHRYTIAAPGSGSIFLDNIFFRELLPLTDSAWEELIALGSSWRYSLPPVAENWFASAFDASSWSEGRAKFGGGTGTESIVTSLPLMQPSYYFRREFNLPNRVPEELLLVLSATDDFNGRTYPPRLFLNGMEVVSSGIDAVTGSGNETKCFDLTPFSDLLHPGVNTIALQLQNGWATDWDNVAFDLSLRAIFAGVATRKVAQFRKITSEPDGKLRMHIVGPPGTAWRVESANAFHPAITWNRAASVIIGTSGEGAVTAEVRAPTAPPAVGTIPGGAHSQFFRLVPE